MEHVDESELAEQASSVLSAAVSIKRARRVMITKLALAISNGLDARDGKTIPKR